jgi:hypothetical protein
LSDSIGEKKSSSKNGKFKNMSTDESIRVLETDSSVGLTLKEVNQRISEYGYNEIEEIRQNRLVRLDYVPNSILQKGSYRDLSIEYLELLKS